MSSAAENRTEPGERTAGALRAAKWLTPLVVVANLIMIAGMGATTDDPDNMVHPFNWLGYTVEAGTATELLAVSVAAVAVTRFRTRAALIARWSARLALTLCIAILALLAWLIA